MSGVTIPPAEEARSIFSNLGYTVNEEGTEFRATRDWKEVQVTPVTEEVQTPEEGTLRCFVTWEEYAPDLTRKLRQANPQYGGAIISVQDGGDSEVARAPSAGK